MKSLWPVVVGLCFAMIWIWWYSGTESYAYQNELYGPELSTMCLGAPSFMIILASMILMILWEERKDAD